MTPRATAALIDRDKKSLERIGVPAAAAVGKVLATQVTAAFNDRASQAVLVAMIQRYMNRLQPLILDGMVAGHLAGRLRAAKLAAQGLAARKRALSAYDDALAYYKKRMDLTPDDIERLRKLYGIKALSVTKSASDLVEKRATAARTVSVICPGSVAPLVSHRQSAAAPASAAAASVRRAYSGSSRYPSKKCSAS